jgi:RNA polymerase sigma-70 factor (ECF subfamily)
LIKDYHYLELQYNYEALEKIGENYIEFQELKEKIDLAIHELPEDLRIVFEMNRFRDMRYKDIAMTLDLSEKTVEARMTKALKILRGKLKDYLPLIYLVSKILS